jgi:hypothetical protein
MRFTRRKLLVATAGLATLVMPGCDDFGGDPEPPGNLVAPEPPPPPPPGNLVAPEPPPEPETPPDNPPPPGNLMPPPQNPPGTPPTENQ